MKNLLLLTILALLSFGTFAQNLSLGLQAHYKFDNNGLDETSNNYDLNLGVSPTYITSNNGDPAIYFDGNQGAAQINSFNNSNFTSTAIAFWFKAEATAQPQQDRTIIQGAYMEFGVLVDDNTGQVGAFFRTPSYSALKSPTNLVDSTWHHVVAQNNGTTTYLYIDGILTGSKQQTLLTGNGNTNNKLYLGRTNQNVRFFKGGLNDLRIYDRVLTQVEIDSLALISCPKRPFQQSLKAHFKFEGNILDATVNNEDLSSSSPVNYQTVSWSNQAIDFNGNTQLISQTPFNNSNYTSTALSMWVKSSLSSSSQCILQGAFMGFAVLIQANTGKALAFFDSSSSNSLVSNSAVADNNWHHIVAQNDGTSTSLYIDGIFQNSHIEPLFTGNGSLNNKLYLGRTVLNSEQYQGLLNDLRIYDRTLSDCEIDSLYQIEKPVIITSVSKQNLISENTILAYPNPTNNLVNLVVEKEQLNSNLIIRNSIGQTIYFEKLKKIGTISIPIVGQAGLYYIELINSQGDKQIIKVIKL